MKMNFTPTETIKKPRKKKIAEATPIIVEEKIKKERAPRTRKIKAEKIPEQTIVADAEREDYRYDLGKAPANLPFEPVENPVDLDNLSLQEIVKKKAPKKRVEEIPVAEVSLSELENDHVTLGKRLEDMVERGEATVETLPPDTAFPSESSEDYAPIQASKPSVESLFKKTHPIQRYPEPLNPLKSPREQKNFFGRLKDRFTDFFVKDVIEDEDE